MAYSSGVQIKGPLTESPDVYRKAPSAKSAGLKISSENHKGNIVFSGKVDDVLAARESVGPVSSGDISEAADAHLVHDDKNLVKGVHTLSSAGQQDGSDSEAEGHGLEDDHLNKIELSADQGGGINKLMTAGTIKTAESGGKAEANTGAISNNIKESSAEINPTQCIGENAHWRSTEEGNSSELWEDECMRYLEQEPAFRARLQYEVRLVIISPVFEIGGRSLSLFTCIYEKKFSKPVENSGFGNAARLCRAMPHVVERDLLSEQGKLQLVDSPKNHRIVAGIRSGLRRVVYDILKLHPDGLGYEEVEVECSRLLGQLLSGVLSDHGYRTPSVECMLRDMLDIAFINEAGSHDRVYLSESAEDPAITDGLLIGRLERVELRRSDSKSVVTKGEPTRFNPHQGSSHGGGDGLGDTASGGAEGSKLGPTGMCFEELGDLQVLRASELKSWGNTLVTSTECEDGFPWSGEDVARQARLRLRLLLALHNEGHGVELSTLDLIYKKMFSFPLDIQALGFSSLEALADCWDDVIQQKSSQPGWVFPVETAENRRVLNTVTTGLRSAVFAILLARYPDGVAPLDLVHCLEQTLSAKIWEVLGSNGYIFDDLNATKELLSSRDDEFQLADCGELKLLLNDLDDFVRLGCREDGSLVIKLRDGDFPLLDLLDCEVVEDVDSATGASTEASTSQLAPSPKGSLKCCPRLNSPIGGAFGKGADVAHHNELQSGKVLPTKVCTRDASITRRLRTRLAPSSSPTPTMEHEIRLILGSKDYIDSGIPVETFAAHFKETTGKSLELGKHETVKQLLEAMPEVVNQDNLASATKVELLQSAKNLRVLSITKAGLRQVLFWSLLKNPGGIWAELLEGWYLDFAGSTLSSTLSRHGYEKSGRSPLDPVFQFLCDMKDVLQLHPRDSRIYIWAGDLEDPVTKDSHLLSISSESIQYDPIREDYENVRMNANLSLHLNLSFDADTETDHEHELRAKLVQQDGVASSKEVDKRHCVDQSDIAKDYSVLRCMVTPHVQELNDLVTQMDDQPII